MERLFSLDVVYDIEETSIKDRMIFFKATQQGHGIYGLYNTQVTY